MAEIPIGGPSGAREVRQSVGAVTSYAGAVVSLALVIGIGAWGYKLLARDVSGVPVVKAASDAPMRIVPEEPGGAEAAHQGLSVNSVMSEGGAEKPADRLVLAPNPVELTQEDMPLQIETLANTTSQAVSPTTESLPELDFSTSDEPISGQMASIKAFADQLAAGVGPLSEDSDVAADPTQVSALAPVVVAEPAVIAPLLTNPEIKRTLRPKMRPVLVAAVAPANTPVTQTPTVNAPTEVDVASIAVGTRLVQLGAFESPEVARKEWNRLGARFEGYLDGKQRVVMRAKSGGRVFYRLRAMGFADLSDARRFCAALVAEKADCIPVVSK